MLTGEAVARPRGVKVGRKLLLDEQRARSHVTPRRNALADDIVSDIDI